MLTVGKLRQQLALADSNEIVCIKVKDSDLRKLLSTRYLEAIESYPDTYNHKDEYGSSFIIDVKLESTS
jgi:hypothetical protein